MSLLFDDIREAGPTSMAATPRFYNVIYNEFQEALQFEQSKNSTKVYLASKEIILIVYIQSQKKN